MWTVLLDRYPAHLRAEYGPAMGIAFVDRLKALAKYLGGDFERRPLSAGPHGAPRAASSAASAASAGGNPKAFAEFIRKAVLDLVGIITL